VAGTGNPLADALVNAGYVLRMGVTKPEYDARFASTQPVLAELSGTPNPNVQDRLLGQLVAAEAGRPEFLIKGAQDVAFGDRSLIPSELAQTRAAGDKGRALGLERRALIEKTEAERRAHVEAQQPNPLAAALARMLGLGQ